MDRDRNITAVILAGGLGTRLRSVVSDKPKVLAEVSGRPFLSFLLDQLGRAALDRVVICIGYMAEKIEQEFGEDYGNIKLLYSREAEPLGTGGALRLALPLITTEYILVMNGDSYIDADLGDYIGWFLQREIDAALFLTHLSDTSRYGSVKVDNDGKIVKFTEKSPDAGAGLINTGVYLLERSLVEKIPPEKPCSLERDVFPQLTDSRLFGFIKPVRFIDIGTPRSYNIAGDFFAGISPDRVLLKD